MLAWSNLKIGWKYGLALALTLLLFTMSAVVISVLIQNIEDDISMLEQNGDRAIVLSDMASLFRSKDIRIADYITLQRYEYIKQFEDITETFNQLEAAIRTEIDTEEQLQLLNQIIENDKKVNNLFINEIVPAISSGTSTNIIKLRKETVSTRTETVDLLQQLTDIVNAERQQAAANAKTAAGSALATLFIAILISINLGITITILVSRLVQRNLNQIVSMSKQIAEGNLDVQDMNYKGKDEIGQLSLAMNTMKNNLREIVQQIVSVSQHVGRQSEELTQSSNEVKIGSEQVASTMQQLAAGAEEQASTSSDIANLIEWLNKQIVQVSNDGVVLHTSSNKVLAMTSEGRTQMDRSVQQMLTINDLVSDSVLKVQKLDQRQNDISKLILVIQDIAEQTNLLALNAAIEAARAGESGRGFAVVADEVRKLAEQVGHSVTEITGIIKGSQNESKLVVQSLQDGYQQVEEGSQVINMTRETFEHINKAVTEMATRIENLSSSFEDIANNSDKISSSSEEIASVSEESAAGIEQTSASVQQQSSTMEEISGSAESLASLAEELNEMVGKFKI